MTDQDWTDPDFVSGAVRAQMEDLTPDERLSLAEQLHREHREGMAADRLETERRRFDWDIEGWSSTDDLLLYIAGSGLHRIPADEVVRLANAMLAEHQMRFDAQGGERHG